VDLQHLQHGHGGCDLQLTGRRELLGGDLAQPCSTLCGLHAAVAQRLSALVETDRVDALHPAGVLAAQVVVEPQQRPGLQHQLRWDPTLRDPAALEQLTQQLRVRPVGLGPLLTTPRGGGIGRLGQVRHHSSTAQLFHHVPPPGAALHRELHIGHTVETAQPHRQIPPIGRSDLPPRQLSRRPVDIVEGQLLSVQIQPAYDRHGNLLTLRDTLMSNAHQARRLAMRLS
jgi:hypothetical protein